jgi:hypothetical protein
MTPISGFFVSKPEELVNQSELGFTSNTHDEINFTDVT